MRGSAKEDENDDDADDEEEEEEAVSVSVSDADDTETRSVARRRRRPRTTTTEPGERESSEALEGERTSRESDLELGLFDEAEDGALTTTRSKFGE